MIYGDSVSFTWCRMYSLKTFLISQLLKHTPHHLCQGYHRNTQSSGEQKALGLGRTHVLSQDAIQVLNGKRHSRHLHNTSLGLQLQHCTGRSLSWVPCHVLPVKGTNFMFPDIHEMVLDTHLQVQELFPSQTHTKWSSLELYFSRESPYQHYINLIAAPCLQLF